MGMREEFSNDEVPQVLSELLREGRLRDAALLELYACSPLSMEQLVKCKLYQLEWDRTSGRYVWNFSGRRGERRIHLDERATSVLSSWIKLLSKREPDDFVFPAQRVDSSHLNARHARRIVERIFSARNRRPIAQRRVDQSLGETLAVVCDGGNVHGCWLSKWPWVECALFGHGAHPRRRCTMRCAGAPKDAKARDF